MKYSVSKTAKLSGVSVRTLHYYDEIGLLCPSKVSDTGYRYYGEEELSKLQQIMFFKELDFSLQEIKDIINSSGYKKEEALTRQKELLILKKNRLEKVINLLEASLKGEKNMDFNEFDMSEIDEAKQKYTEEARQRWGETHAYKQSYSKTSRYTKEDWERINKKYGQILEEFAAIRGELPGNPEVRKLVKMWQDFITESYYDCSDEILKGLGEMYVADERFKKNLDKYGEGTAEFMSKAIKEY